MLYANIRMNSNVRDRVVQSLPRFTISAECAGRDRAKSDRRNVGIDPLIGLVNSRLKWNDGVVLGNWSNHRCQGFVWAANQLADQRGII